jgi:hypothetical protein
VIHATSVALQGSGRGLVRAMGRDRKHATNQTRGSGGTGHYPTCGRNGRRHLLKPATRCCADMPSLGRVLPSHEAGARGDVKATGDSCLGYQTGRGPLGRRLAELAPGRIALLAGPRQVGETTLLLEIAEQACERAVYAAADPPEAESPGFWERVVGRAEAAAAAHGRAILLLDEAHLVHGWAAHPKGACDRFREVKTPFTRRGDRFERAAPHGGLSREPRRSTRAGDLDPWVRASGRAAPRTRVRRSPC